MSPRVKIVARIGPGAPSRPFVFMSLAAHALFLGMIVLFPGMNRKHPFPQDFLTVELAAALPPGETANVSPPAPPEPEPSRPEGVSVDAPPSAVIEKPEPKPRPKKTEPPRPAPPRAASHTPAGGEDVTPMGAVGDAAGSIAPSGDGDAEFAWYRASVSAALYSHWQRPVLSGIRNEVEVQIDFAIQRDGAVRDLRVSRGSGIPSMDRSAQRAVLDASPLPPLPSNWDESSLAASFIFRLFPGEY